MFKKQKVSTIRDIFHVWSHQHVFVNIFVDNDDANGNDNDNGFSDG